MEDEVAFPPLLGSVGLRWMGRTSDRPSLEERIGETKALLAKYMTGEAGVTPAVVAELAKAVHEIGDHLVELHRRFEKIEQTLPEWTTRGWMPPPGSDSPRDD